MTNAALRGQPDAGNPHVRFDEGEVAPAASLLYKNTSTLTKATRRILLAVAVGTCATLIVEAETYYWSGSTAAYSTANGWATADGSTTITYTSPTDENYTVWAEDDFVVRTGKAIITSADANNYSFYFNTKSLALEGDFSRFYYRGANLYNCHFILCGGSILYCWGRGDFANDSHITSSSSIEVSSSATRDTPATIDMQAPASGIDLACPIMGDGALLLANSDQTKMLPGRLSADNSRFTGIMKLKGPSASKLQTIEVKDANALGGDPATFEQYGLELEYAKISATVDAATTANRGLYVTANSTIDVASGKTLTIPGAFAFADAAKTLTKAGAGTLVISGGLHSGAVCGTMKLNAGTFALFGGGAAVNASKLDFSSASSVALAINGGATLVADTDIAANANLTLTVNGGVIDTAGSAVTIADDIGGTGSVMFKGGTTATLSGTVGYSGKTFIAAGTTIAVSGMDAATILSHGLDLVGAPVPNTPYTVLTSTDDLSGANLDNVTCGLATSFTKAVVGGNSIVVTVTGDIKHGYWTGAVGDGKISNTGNWSDGTPAAGDALDFSGVASGAAIIGDTDVTYGAVTIVDKITFSGTFAATSFSDTSKISVAANSTVTLDGDLRFSNTASRYILGTIGAGGRFVVTGDIEQTSSATAEIKPFSGDGALVAKGLVSNARNGSGTDRDNIYLFRLDRPSTSTLNWIIGSDGLSGNRRFCCFGSADSNVNIQPDNSDFDISTVIGAWNSISLNLNTTGYDGNAHKITFSTGSINQSGTVNIKGNGTVELANSIYGNNPFYVQDTAMLSVKRGKDAGNYGALTVASGATLEIAESAASAGAASVTRRGNLTLANGAKLKFNFTDRSIAPVLAKSNGTTVAASGKVYVVVSATGVDKPRSGEHILTTCGGFTTVELVPDAPKWARGVSVNGDGNIVLNVKAPGMMLFVR